MVLMAALTVFLVVGVALTVAWGATPYRRWRHQPRAPEATAEEDGEDAPSLTGALLRYLRGVALALVGGFWAGALVTGPAMRLIMRLLAVTGGDSAQGKITEAEEVVGDIDFDGTMGLYIFGGLLPGLLSGAIYVVIRRWLPAGRLGGVAFGLLHLVVAATRVDPLRPDNPDFDLVGPGWLSVLTFGAAAIVHGMAVAAIVNRFSVAFPPPSADMAARLRAFAPLVPPALMLIPGAFLLIPIGIGLALAVPLLIVDGSSRIARGRSFDLAGRIALAAIALVLLPGAITDLGDIVTRQ